MPELPEVETIKIQLSGYLLGLRFEKITVNNRKSFQGDELKLKGAKITWLERAGKVLLIKTDKKYTLAVHLKMTGQLVFKTDDGGGFPDKYTRAIFYLSGGARLFFNDLRKFGWIRILTQKSKFKTQNHNLKLKTGTLEELIKKMGPDPLKITNDLFYKILQTSKKPVKLLLTDQEKLAGVGNIYSNEALFDAGINPGTAANKISSVNSGRLHKSLIKSLEKGLKYGGASENNYRNADGEKGKMQEHFLVYSREGKQCANSCGGIIKRIKQGGRSSFYCPVCQN